MPCYYPIAALQHWQGGRLIFEKPEHYYLYTGWKRLKIPCGQCSGCRMKQSRTWAIRCVHEKQMHEHSAYITLTYAQLEHHELRYNDYVKFMKRLRRLIERRPNLFLKNSCPTNPPVGGAGIPPAKSKQGGAGGAPQKPVARHPLKFYMCGEYGELYGRPHFHALLFGIDFADKLYHSRSPGGEKLYRSATLEKLWPHGFSTTGEVTLKSAAYVARYIMKKRTGDGNKTHYQVIDLDTGEITPKKKEFNQMSRKEGIGKTWLKKYTSDVYTTGKVIVAGHPVNPPRYYDKIFKKIDAAALDGFKHQRLIEALAHKEHQTPERLAVQEQVQQAKTRTLKRTLT